MMLPGFCGSPGPDPKVPVPWAYPGPDGVIDAVIVEAGEVVDVQLLLESLVTQVGFEMRPEVVQAAVAGLVVAAGGAEVDGPFAVAPDGVAVPEGRGLRFW